MDQIPEQALEWHQQGKGAALATVVQTWGSAPRRVGAMLAVSGDGDLAGSVSGGCVEGAVITEAFDALETGQSVLLSYGVSDDDAFAVGLACGGTIRILLQPVGSVTGLPVEILTKLCQARAAREPVAHVINTLDWTQQVADHSAYPDRFRADRSGFEVSDRGGGKNDAEAPDHPSGIDTATDTAQTTFVAIHNPPLRMVIVGAVHIAQALVPMARLAGYDPVIIDPRPAFAAQSRFPGEDIRDAYPDEVLDGLLDSRTALVLLTHDPKIDDPALVIALRSPVFYIGALGSTRTHAKRVTRLTEKSFTAGEIARIHAPVGLNIGAAGPAEIAVATLAQITQVLRQGA